MKTAMLKKKNKPIDFIGCFKSYQPYCLNTGTKIIVWSNYTKYLMKAPVNVASLLIESNHTV